MHNPAGELRLNRPGADNPGSPYGGAVERSETERGTWDMRPARNVGVALSAQCAHWAHPPKGEARGLLEIISLSLGVILTPPA